MVSRISFLLFFGFFGVQMSMSAQISEDQFPPLPLKSPPSVAIIQNTMPTAAPKGRLPEDITPLAYTLYLKIDPRAPHFEGAVTMDFSLNGARSGMWLHGTDLAVSRAELRDASEQLSNVAWRPSDVAGVNWVDFGQILPAGTYGLHLNYTAQIDQNLSGLFSVSTDNGAFAMAKSESIQARKFLPSIDQPSSKASYNITIDAPEGFIAISNGALKQERRLDNGWNRFVFGKTRPLPTYLLAVTVGDFARKNFADIPPNAQRSHPIPLTGYAQKSKIDQLDFALSMTARLVAYYETIFGLPYPYSKLDIIAAPAWPSGATELAGAITYRESRILLPENARVETRNALLRLHTHELTHMWFGNLVTPDWWEDLWLKEAFATWGTPIALDALFPDEGHDIDALVSALSAIKLDSLTTTRAVKEKIEDTANVRSAYDAITYRKGMAVISMVDTYFGPNIFRPALGEFLTDNIDGVTNSDDFFGFFQNTLKLGDVARVFEAYVAQRGIPLVGIDKTCTPDGQTRVALTQTRYAPLDVSFGKSGGPRWPVPLCVAPLGGPRMCTLFDEAVKVWTLEHPCETPLHPNAGGTGYYRFRLNDTQWRELSTVFGQLSTSEAIVALDNGLAQFEDGQLGATVFTDLIAASTTHNDWRVYAYPLDAFETWLTYMSVADQDAFRERLRAMYLPVMRRLDAEIASEARTSAINILSNFLFTVTQDRFMTEQIHARTRHFFGLDRSASPTPLRPNAYTSAFISALRYDPSMFAVMFKNMTSAADTRVRLSLASAIGEAVSPKDVAVLLRALESGDLNLRETYYVLEGLMKNPIHRQAIWPWFEASLPNLSTNIPSQWRGNLPSLARHFCTKISADRLQALFKAKGEFAPGHAKALRQTVEKIRNCAVRRDLLESKLTEIL